MDLQSIAHGIWYHMVLLVRHFDAASGQKVSKHVWQRPYVDRIVSVKPSALTSRSIIWELSGA
jgi:hypothetical protein